MRGMVYCSAVRVLRRQHGNLNTDGSATVESGFRDRNHPCPSQDSRIAVDLTVDVNGGIRPREHPIC